MPGIIPFIPAIIGGVASLAGGALANKSSQTTTPTAAPGYQGLQAQILQMIQQRLGTDPNLTGYTGQGVSTINAGYNTAAQTQENDLTRRGLATSPIAANVDATRNNARVGAVTSFRNSIPLLARQLQGEDLNSANALLRTGMGSTSTGQSGGGAAGAFENLAAYLGYLQGKGTFAQAGKAPLPARQTVPNTGFLPAGGGGY